MSQFQSVIHELVERCQKTAIHKQDADFFRSILRKWNIEPTEPTSGEPLQLVCVKCGERIYPDYGHCKKAGGIHKPAPSAAPGVIKMTTGVLVSTERYNKLAQSEQSLIDWRMRAYDAIKAVYDLTGIDENTITEMLATKDRPFHTGITVAMPADTGWIVELAHSRQLSLGSFIRKIVSDKLSELKSAAASPKPEGPLPQQAYNLLREAHENLVSVHICGTTLSGSNLAAMCGENAQRIDAYLRKSRRAERPEGGEGPDPEPSKCIVCTNCGSFQFNVDGTDELGVLLICASCGEQKLIENSASPVPSAALSKKAAELYETYRQDNWDHNHPEWKHLTEVERLEWYEKARMASAAPQSTLKEGLLKADKMAEEMGLELLAKGDKHGWSVLDDLGHRLREALEE